MANIPAKVLTRITKGLDQFQPIIKSARARDLNESDTVTIVTDLLSEILGYDKYTEVTSEIAIRGSYCDLAIKVEGNFEFLIEVKAIGMELKESHIRQAVNYAANQGIEWVILTNAVTWRIFRIGFGKPISRELLCEFDLLSLDPKSASDMEPLFLITREALPKSALDAYHAQRQATNRFILAAVILSEPVLKIVRREVRRLSPGVKIDLAEIEQVLEHEVIKRDVLQGDQAEEALREAKTPAGKTLRPGPRSGPDEPRSRRRTSPAVFMFLGRRYTGKSWKDVFIEICALMHTMYPSDFERVLELRGTKRPWFSHDPNDVRRPALVPGTDIYADTNLAAKDIVRQSKRIVSLFGHSPDDLVAEVQ